MVGSLINEGMKVEGFLHAEDPLSTMLALNQIGSAIESVDGKFINIKKRKTLFLEPEQPLDLGNSGT
jgi:5-enolpyruvylshikimate-3-phosphate synthase